MAGGKPRRGCLVPIVGGLSILWGTRCLWALGGLFQGGGNSPSPYVCVAVAAGDDWKGAPPVGLYRGLSVCTRLAWPRLPFPSEPWFPGCGHTNVACKVVKGQLVEVGKWPWQVSIFFLGVYICSGSLVHHQWVLTAAHCFQRSADPKNYSVMVGVQHLPEHGTQLPLTHVVIHEDFNNLISKDIALLKLRDPVSWSPLVQPVCLPNTQVMPSLGTVCWVIGWGRSKAPVTPNTSYSLQEMAVRIINSRICDRRYQFLLLKDQKKFIGDDMLCANLEWATDLCQDNYGSSMVCQVNKTWVQMGVVSWTFSCNQHRFPGIYTSTSYFTHWIRRQITNVTFISRAHLAVLSPVLLTACVLLGSPGSTRLL